MAKVAGIISGNSVPVDSFYESMDSYQLVDHESGFVSYRGSQILTWKYLFRVMDHESSHFQKIQPVFMIPINTHKSLRIFSTIAQNESLWIQAGKLANLDSQVRTLKICFVDSFRNFYFSKLPNLFWFGRICVWIRILSNGTSSKISIKVITS